MHMPRPIAAIAATGTLVVVATAGVVAMNATSSDSAQLAASCDPNPAVTGTTEGSQVTVTCTVPRTTVTVTADPTPTDPAPTETPKPTDPPTTPTPTPSDPPPTVTPKPTETPKPSPTTPAASKAVLGASLGQNLPAPHALEAVRYYRAPAWKGSELEAAYKAGTRVFVVSTKDATPTNMVALVKAAPSDAQFFVTSYHEPDDNIAAGTLTVATYCARMNAMTSAVGALPNVKVGPIHNGFIGAATWKADEKGCDTSGWEFWGEDRYSPGYESATKQYTEGAQYAKSLGLPLVLGEIGADPSNATGQKSVAASARAYALDPSNNVAAILWWQQTGYTFANSDVEKAFLG